MSENKGYMATRIMCAFGVALATLVSSPARASEAISDEQLLRAVADGKAEEVKALINAGANPDAQSDQQKQPALNLAAAAGYKKIVEILLAAGADINGKDQAGVSALSRALKNDKKEVAELILAVKSGKITVAELRTRTGVTAPARPVKKVEASIAQPAPAPARPALEVLDFAWGFTNYGSTCIRGTVRNNSDYQYKWVEVEFNLYDEAKNLVGGAFAGVANLEPHGTWRFEALVLDSYGAKTAKLKAVKGE